MVSTAAILFNEQIILSREHSSLKSRFELEFPKLSTEIGGCPERRLEFRRHESLGWYVTSVKAGMRRGEVQKRGMRFTYERSQECLA